MSWFILSYLFSTLISLVSIGRLSEQEKDLEILLLRHQMPHPDSLRPFN